MTRPLVTMLVGIVIILIIGIGSITPRAFNDLYDLAFPPALENPYSSERTVHANWIPVEGDIINLDNAGTLTPAPANARLVQVADGMCAPGEQVLDYSKGILMILNSPVW